MPFANDIKLEEALLQLIGAWNGDRDEFRTILNNAIDIHVDPDWLVAKLAIHVGEKPPVIQSWRKGSY